MRTLIYKRTHNGNPMHVENADCEMQLKGRSDARRSGQTTRGLHARLALFDRCPNYSFRRQHPYPDYVTVGRVTRYVASGVAVLNDLAISCNRYEACYGHGHNPLLGRQGTLETVAPDSNWHF